MEEVEILNLLRRLSSGEKISVEDLDKLEESLYRDVGFIVHISSSPRDYMKIYVSPRVEILLRRRDENLDRLTVRRSDKPNVFLKGFKVVSDLSLKHLHLRMYESEIEDLYSRVKTVDDKLPFRAKLVLGENNKVFKDLPPINSNMRVESDIDDLINGMGWVLLYFHKLSEEDRMEEAMYAEDSYRRLEKVFRLRKKGYRILDSSGEEVSHEDLKRGVQHLEAICILLRGKPPRRLQLIKGYSIPRNRIRIPHLFPEVLGFNKVKFTLLSPELKVDLGTMKVEPYRERGLKPYQVGISNEILDELDVDVENATYDLEIIEDKNVDASRVRI